MCMPLTQEVLKCNTDAVAEQVGIEWPIPEGQMLLSPKDRAGKPLSEVYCFD